MERVILEWGYSRATLEQHLAETGGSVTVVSNDEAFVTSIREDMIPVYHADPADRETLASLAGDAKSVLIAAGQADRTIEIARAARATLPSATIAAVAGMGATPAYRAELYEHVDHVVDRVDVVADAILERTTRPAAIRAHRVRTVLDQVDGELAVVMHDNPDPDAIASAVALTRLAAALDIPARAYYYGEITHQSNRAFINLFEFDIERLDPEAEPPAGTIALVDHAIPGINDSLPGDMPVALIFDHHTPSGPVEGRYVDLRETVGATCSIMVEYLRQMDIPIDRTLASALLYGIRTDTKNFSRKVTPIDFEAARHVWPLVDHDALARIEQPGVTSDTLELLADAIVNRSLRGPFATACVGTISQRDAISQAAELLVQMDGVHAVLVYGFRDGIAYASARASGGGYPIDLAAVMRDAFGQIGTAGGHEEMAGAQIPLGLLEAPWLNEEDPQPRIREVIDERFFEAITDMVRVDRHPLPRHVDRPSAPPTDSESF